MRIYLHKQIYFFTFFPGRQPRRSRSLNDLHVIPHSQHPTGAFSHPDTDIYEMSRSSIDTGYSSTTNSSYHASSVISGSSHTSSLRSGSSYASSFLSGSSYASSLLSGSSYASGLRSGSSRASSLRSGPSRPSSLRSGPSSASSFLHGSEYYGEYKIISLIIKFASSFHWYIDPSPKRSIPPFKPCMLHASRVCMCLSFLQELGNRMMWQWRQLVKLN